MKNDSNQDISQTEGVASLKGNNVLVVDDSIINRTVLCSILQTEGISFFEVEDGVNAVREYINSPSRTFDLILLDMKMPNMDGMETIKAIRFSSKSDALTIPIIAVSADSFDEDTDKAFSVGVTEYLLKPIDRNLLIKTLCKYLTDKSN